VILDTNCLSALADGHPAIEPLLSQATIVAIPTIVLGEYRFGIRASRNRRVYEQWLKEALPDFQILDVNEETAEFYADVRSRLKEKGRPIPSNDLWIASLATQHRMLLVSRDAHFDFVAGLKRVSW
jgi:tRNA(fMet)-specific endonuclease VapC